MNFHLTDAGRAAITNAANRRTNQVVFTRMVVGDGLAQSGVDDSGRVALGNERQRQGLTAVVGGVARIGVGQLHRRDGRPGLGRHRGGPDRPGGGWS